MTGSQQCSFLSQERADSCWTRTTSDEFVKKEYQEARQGPVFSCEFWLFSNRFSQFSFAKDSPSNSVKDIAGLLDFCRWSSLRRCQQRASSSSIALWVILRPFPFVHFLIFAFGDELCLAFFSWKPMNPVSHQALKTSCGHGSGPVVGIYNARGVS